MTEKVVSLQGKPLPVPGEPVEDVVKQLEDILQRAKSGEINGFVAVVTHADECVSAYQSIRPNLRVIGMLTVLAAEYASDYNVI